MRLLISFLVTMFYFVKKKNTLVKSFHFLAFLTLLQRRFSQYNLEKLPWKGCVNAIDLTGVTKLIFMSFMKGINFQRELLSICKLHSKTVGLFYPFKKNKTKIFLDTKMKKVLFLNYQNKSEISKKV